MRTPRSADAPEPRPSPGPGNGAEPAGTGVRRGPTPPRQARSRALLEKVLVAAEDVLGGDDELTMAGVAERAGVSVGALYRRFDGKEQLLEAVRARVLDRMEADLSESLATGVHDLTSVVETYVETVVRNIAGPADVFRQFVAQTRSVPHSGDRALTTLAVLQRLLFDAAAPHLAQIRRPDPATALAVAGRLVLGACIQRVLIVRHAPDGLSWQRWSAELTDMVLLYLAGSGPSRDR